MHFNLFNALLDLRSSWRYLYKSSSLSLSPSYWGESETRGKKKQKGKERKRKTKQIGRKGERMAGKNGVNDFTINQVHESNMDLEIKEISNLFEETGNGESDGSKVIETQPSFISCGWPTTSFIVGSRRTTSFQGTTSFVTRTPILCQLQFFFGIDQNY